MRYTGRYLVSFALTLAMLGTAARAFSYPAEVTDISGRKYFLAVKEALVDAKESISIAMYLMEVSSNKEDSKVNQLVNELITAKKRGVDVEVILDQNIDFVNRASKADWQAEIKSYVAYLRLKQAGIKVYYDEPARYLHAKAIVIDKKVVILGSTIIPGTQHLIIDL